jgi:hypothetical protein
MKIPPELWPMTQVWQTKWWPNRQFTFLLSVAEVNCVQAMARARKDVPESTLTFCKKLAMLMLKNKIQSNGVAAASPLRLRVRTSSVDMLRKQATREGKWNHSSRAFNKVNSNYVRYPCFNCKTPIRTYCACDPGAPLCSICFGLQAQEHGNRNNRY